MKKIISIILLAVIISTSVLFTGCGEVVPSNAQTSDEADTTALSDTTPTADPNQISVKFYDYKTNELISKSKDINIQRNHFTTLSKDIYSLIKVAKYEVPVYFQHCPMYNDGKGANWLSKENAVKNPYYGSMMLTCGKTVETIK